MTPIALFVYNRTDTTRKTLDALIQNTLAAQTDLYVFSDGGRDEASWKKVNEVRQLLQAFKEKAEKEGLLHSVTLVLRPENLYLERNVMEGIAEVLQHHDSIIAMEDDIITSPYFLQYMNEALELYRDEPRVMHVAGFTNLNLIGSPLLDKDGSETYFTPHMSGAGAWATWRNRWQQYFHHYETEEEALSGLSEDDCRRIQYDGAFPCLRLLQKRPVPWDICWEIAIYKAQGLCLSPAHTLIRNIGLRQGTHFSSWRSSRLLQYYEFDRNPLQRALRLKKTSPQISPAIEAAFTEAIRDWGIRYTWLGRIIRFVYLRFFRSNS